MSSSNTIGNSMSGGQVLRVTILCTVISTTAAAARAQVPQNSASTKPTALSEANSPERGSQGVPTADDADKRKALALFQAGTRLARDSHLTLAAEKYQDALAYWQHPGIYAALGRVVMALNQPLAAYWYVDQALCCGPAPLGPDDATSAIQYQQLLTIRAQLRAQLGEIYIDSAKPNADAIEVFVDGDALPIGVQGSRLVLPGAHRLVIQKTGHKTLSHATQVAEGTARGYWLTSERRMTPWKPWALLSGGAALSLLGGGVYLDAWRRHRKLEDRLAEKCKPPNGCPDDQRTVAAQFPDAWKGVQWREHSGIAALVTGGLVLASATGLLLWNRQRHFRLQPVEQTLALTPVVSSQMAGVNATLSF